LPKKTRQKRIRRDDPAQSRLFIKKAREIDADQDKSAADELIGHLQHKPPAPRQKKVTRAAARR
jgi:hypothetical protein